MRTFHQTAYAKVNLALHIRGRRPDGYHELDTLFAFVDSGDELTACAASELTLSIQGPFKTGLANGDDNLVLQAANAMRSRFKIKEGATISLDKRLPVASGIGGGSADAAAAARLLNQLWDIGASDEELADILAPLGADIPACVASRTMRGQGVGTVLTSIDATELSGTSILLVNPGYPLSTSAVFAAWNGIDGGSIEVGGGTLRSVLLGRNDLQMPAVKICPEIDDVLISLSRQRPIMARMSGSGATCFALYETIIARDEAKNCITRDHPNWWTLSGRLR